MGSGGETSGGALFATPVAERNPRAMKPAEKTMKQPITITAPRRAAMRPLSMSSPIEAIAMTATIVASDPVSTAADQSAAPTSDEERIIGLGGGGTAGAYA